MAQLGYGSQNSYNVIPHGTIAFNGSGLTPGQQLTATLSTDQGNFALGTLTADASGNISQNVTVGNATALTYMEVITGPPGQPQSSMTGSGSYNGPISSGQQIIWRSTSGATTCALVLTVH